MSFLYPQFLWALFAIAIPIIIHLFNFRKFKRVYFSNVGMLKEVELQTNKRSKLRNLLILLARILAIAALVIAFAQPYFKKKDKVLTAGSKSVAVYVDNSYSMEAESPDGNLLYLAKQKAIQIANNYKPTDEFLLLTNDFEGKHQRFVSREEFVDLVEEVNLSPKQRLISKVYQKQQDLMKTNAGANNAVYWLSDFQKTSSDIASLTLDTIDLVNVIKLEPNSRDNVFIDSVWFTSPVRKINTEEELYVKIVNKSAENVQVRVELSINNQVKSFNNLLVEGNSSKEGVLTFKEREEGMKNGKVTIGEYPNPVIDYDDEYYFGYFLKSKARVLAINSTSAYNDSLKGSLNQLFRTDDFFKISNVSFGQVNYAELNGYNLVILNSVNEVSSGLQAELVKYVEAGGSLVVFPGESIKPTAYSEFLLGLNIGRVGNLDTANTKVTSINYQHEIYDHVFQETPHQIDLPTVFSHYPIIQSARAKSEKLLTMRNGDAFLSKYSSGKGQIYLFNVPLNNRYSNLPNHSIFVATMLRIAESSGFQKEIAYTIQDKPIVINDENYQLENIKIKTEDESFEFIPESQRVRGDVQFFFNEQVNQSGNYQILYENRKINAFGLNYDRKESYLDCLSKQEIVDELGDQIIYNEVSSKFEAKSNEVYTASSKLWKWFIILTLLFLLIEIALVRFLK